MKNLHPNANVAVFGATGGIGRAMVETLADENGVATVHALARTAPDVESGKVETHPFDLLDEQSIESAVAAISRDAPLDLVFVATGVLHRGDALQPEKAMRDLDRDAMADVLAINTIGPALVAKHCLPAMRRDHRSVFAALSARVGSISDNRLGGWLSYRMSKSALNMVLRTLSIEQTRKASESIVVALHPGTVDTRLSAPFTSRVPESKLFDTNRAARQLLDVIEGLTPDDTGGFFAWDGKPIEF